MKKIIFLLLLGVALSSCGILGSGVIGRTYVSDYGEKMELVRTNFPEIYDLYRRGTVVINDVYKYEKDGRERVGINYHYR